MESGEEGWVCLCGFSGSSTFCASALREVFWDVFGPGNLSPLFCTAELRPALSRPSYAHSRPSFRIALDPQCICTRSSPTMPPATAAFARSSRNRELKFHEIQGRLVVLERLTGSLLAARSDRLCHALTHSLPHFLTHPISPFLATAQTSSARTPAGHFPRTAPRRVSAGWPASWGRSAWAS